MLLEAIYHKPYSEYAFPVDADTLVIRLRTGKNNVEACMVVYHEKYDPLLKGSLQMEKIASDELFDYYEAKLIGPVKRFKYMFYIEDHLERKWYNHNGFFSQRPERGHFCYSYLNSEDAFEEVDWFVNSTVYQIFPDRFCRIPENLELEGLYYGGNIKGIMSRIDYLIKLGVDALYLNPVFKSESYHRYDITDNYEIDPVLGCKEELKEFIEICHKNNIKVVFDGVFNHISDNFFAFQDVKLNGSNSVYKDWFYIKSYPLVAFPQPNYQCFGFFGGMPKLNIGNKEVAKYIQDVVKYWTLEFGIDGWRFDVADEIERNFWRELRIQLRSYAKEVVLIGEIFDEASTWLCGDQFYSVTNYPLKSLINDLFAYRSIDAELFRMRLNNYIMKFNSKVLNSMLNIISTHDTPRFLTLCAKSQERFELGVVFQFTFPGVPLIYYGDDIGMEGEDDPDCRRPMIWIESEWNRHILKLYRFFIDLRRNNSVLRNGIYRDYNVIGNRDILAFKRENEKDKLIIVMNTTDKKAKGSIDLGNSIKPSNMLECVNSKTLYKLESGRLKIVLDKYEWKILKPFVN